MFDLPHELKCSPWRWNELQRSQKTCPKPLATSGTGRCVREMQRSGVVCTADAIVFAQIECILPVSMRSVALVTNISGRRCVRVLVKIGVKVVLSASEQLGERRLRKKKRCGNCSSAEPSCESKCFRVAGTVTVRKSTTRRSRPHKMVSARKGFQRTASSDAKRTENSDRCTLLLLIHARNFLCSRLVSCGLHVASDHETYLRSRS